MGIIKDYTFGELVKNGEIPSYKIQSEGKITVYMQIL